MSVYEIKKPKKINPVSITIFLVVFTVGYFAYFIIPIWWPVFQMTSIMRGICNDAYRKWDDEFLMKKMLTDASRTRLPVTAENFKIERTRYLDSELPPGLDADTSKIFASRGKSIRITMHYVSHAKWPIFGKKIDIPWNRSVSEDLAIIHY